MGREAPCDPHLQTCARNGEGGTRYLGKSASTMTATAAPGPTWLQALLLRARPTKAAGGRPRKATQATHPLAGAHAARLLLVGQERLQVALQVVYRAEGRLAEDIVLGRELRQRADGWPAWPCEGS